MCQCTRALKKRVQAGWSGWRRVSGVIWDRRFSSKTERDGKSFRMAMRPVMMYGLETMALTKKQEAELELHS